MARIKEKEDPSFAYARQIEEERLTEGEKASFQPAFSPDGKEIAYLEERTTVRVMDLDKKRSRVVLPGKYNYSYSDGDQSFEWSPDGKWILAQFFEEGGWQHPDIALVKADGKGEIHNLTNSGYSDGNARWVLGGKAIIWSTDREGMRSHGSWGAQRDVYALFLDPKAYAEFRRTKEERTLAEKLKSEREKRREEKDSVKQADKPAEQRFDLEDLEERMVRLTIHSSALGDAVLTHDGRKLFYLAAFEGGYDLWVRNFDDGSTRLLSKLGRGGRLELSKDGRTIYLLSGGQIQTIDPASGHTKPMSYTARFEWKPAAERRSLFEHVWRQVLDKFYDQTFEGVDWDYYKSAYERFLPYVNNDYDFAEVLGELLGELNASHTGASGHLGGGALQTATLCAFYDPSYTGKGLRIDSIMPRSPLSAAKADVKAGDIILAIDGVEIEPGKDYYPLLAGKAGRKTRITVEHNGKQRTVEVRPASAGFERELRYAMWVERNEKLVDSLSNGRIGYVHIRGMNNESFQTVYSRLLGKYRNCDAVVVDTRFNGGGWLHNDVALLLNGKEYVRYSPRGRYIGSDPFSQWTKPSVMLVNEANYSDAHGTPYTYQTLGIGKVVGAPIPGTMTAVWWENQIDPTLVFGIPQVTSLDRNGQPLENKQLNPDVVIYNNPADELRGIDTQLIESVKTLLRQIDNK